jgi:two-component system NtrC family sensor kinase
MKRIFKAKISNKLVISLLSIVVISGINSVIISRNVINKNVVGQAYEDVRSNLNTAQYVYYKRVNIIYLFTRHLASLGYLQAAILHNNRQLLSEKLNEVKKELDLDIMTITDASGRVIARANGWAAGDDVSGDRFVSHVIKTRQACSGTDIISRELLMREDRKLADQAFIKVIPTPRARRIDKTIETSGMCQKAAAPILSGNRLIGVVYGAKLLNNNFELVDRIKNLLFKNERIHGYEIGTVTIFMDGLRIATNVKNAAGRRAVGTQVSEEVYRKVIEHGEVWLDKAFVVNNWYLSAYSPIHDINNRVVGILYVGILEEKYDIIKRNATIFALLVTLITALAAIILSAYLVKSIITPINSLVAASKEIAQGNYCREIFPNSHDELGYLCVTFNRMIDAISERDQKLKEQTEMQIVQSEKLASLGRLASGIAHEINNPLTGVLSYSTALYDEIEDEGCRSDLKVIIDETLRCREIVKGILDFARETKTERLPGDINKIITDLLSILEKHVNFQNIRVKKQLSENLPEIYIDSNQIKSVINNLTVNAVDAMHDGGELTISTEYDEDDNEVVVQVSDTGVGIKEENLTKIFDPFFTTKETGKGTGLGLAVTYGIVKRHNGTIRVDSSVGKGTTFTITFPVESEAAGQPVQSTDPESNI